MTRVSAERQRAYRLARRYGLTPEQYDALRGGADAPCALCQRHARLGAYRTGRRITGFVCWGCRTGLRVLQRFPHLRALLNLRASDRVARLLGPAQESEHRSRSPDSIPVRDRSESVKGAHASALAQADLAEAQRRLAVNPQDRAALRVLAGLRDRTGPDAQ